MWIRKRVLYNSLVPGTPFGGPYHYDSEDYDISLGDDKSIEALSDSDSDEYETFMMSNGSDLRSEVS